VARDRPDYLNLARAVDINVSFHCCFLIPLRKTYCPLGQAIILDPQPTIASGWDGDRPLRLTFGDLFSQVIQGGDKDLEKKPALVNWERV
jgi:hypothetical protein